MGGKWIPALCVKGGWTLVTHGQACRWLIPRHVDHILSMKSNSELTEQQSQKELTHLSVNTVPAVLPSRELLLSPQDATPWGESP